MARLFTFGCSYTKYAWPMWSDMIGVEFDEFYNWGNPGLGNRAIAERVAEAHARHHITSDDIVIVQWSSHLRNDWWHKYSLPERGQGWKTAGSVFNFINEKLYDQKWIGTFFYEPAFFMHTLNNIMLTQGLLNSIGCKWFMTSIGDIRNLGADIRDHKSYGEKGNLTNPFDSNKSNVAWTKIPEMQFYDDVIWGDNADKWLMPLESFAKQHNDLTYGYIDDSYKGSNEFEVDLHPTPRQCLMWVEHELKDKLNLSDHTIEIASAIADKVDDHYTKNKSSKKKFSIMLSDKDFFKTTSPELSWPPAPNGF